MDEIRNYVIGVVVTLVLIFGMIGTNCTKVKAGQVGVRTHLLGGDKGDIEVLGTGRHWTFFRFNVEDYVIPTSQQINIWTADRVEGSEGDESFKLQTKDGMVAEADVGIQYHIDSDPEMIKTMFRRYRSRFSTQTDIVESIESVLRAKVRDAMVEETAKIGSEELYGEKRMDVIDSAFKKVAQELKPDGIIVEKLYWVNAIRLPKQIIDALNAKVQATQDAQRVENEIKKAKAEAEIKLVEARAEAEQNRLRLTVLNDLILREKWIEKWDGQLPSVVSDKSLIQLPK